MKIVILNESFLQEEHLQKLRQLGEVEVYTDTGDEQTAIERLKTADVAVADCWLTPLNSTVLSQVPQLRYLVVNSTGYDQVDLAAARAHNISIANVPGFSTEGVAEHAIALLFAITRHITVADKAMHRKPFQIDPADTANNVFTGIDLRGKTIGVIGLGNIGTRIAELAQGLGMHVIGYNRTPRSIPGVKNVTFGELIAQSDVVSLSTALHEEIKDLINAAVLQKMKPTAYLINTARGGLVNESDLAAALQQGTIAGAGLDVITDWSLDNPLLQCENVVLTPHLAFFTAESLQNMANIIVANIEGFAEGQQPNVVN